MITQKQKIKCLTVIILSWAFLINFSGFTQGVSINSDGSIADPSAILDISDTSKGILVPRITELQKNSISSPATGLLIYQTDGVSGFYYNSGTPGSPSWQQMGGGGGTYAGPGIAAFTSSDPAWTVPAGVSTILVEAWGGGGGGGGGGGFYYSNGGGGGSGGSGSYSKASMSVTPGSSIAIVVGAGGAGGAAGNPLSPGTDGSNGVAGGNTSVNGTVVAYGGGYGVKGNAGSSGGNGAGGASYGQGFSIAGNNGQTGKGTNTNVAVGGASVGFATGNNFGAGGNGGYGACSGCGTSAGTSGNSGCVIIYY